MGCARPVRAGFFPLAEELQLLPGQLSPVLQEQLVRLGTWMPFPRAAQMLTWLTGAAVREATARRLTEQAGAAYADLQTEEAEHELSEPVPAQNGSQPLVMSVDGAMVPLLHGEWAEVRTLAIGEVPPAVKKKDEWRVPTDNISYFSRLADAQTFTRLAGVEVRRRGVSQAGRVAAVGDGAEWVQGFTDQHRPDAVRILDLMHACEYLSKIAQAGWAKERVEGPVWFERQRQVLKQPGPRPVLGTVRDLREAHPHLTAIAESLAYLEKRVGQMQYPTFQADGWPIGSGMVESGNKLVVEARLKGAGMHWARAHVSPMVALRSVVCSDRWDEAWSPLQGRLRQQVAQRSQQRRLQRRATQASQAQPPLVAPPPPAPPSDPPTRPARTPHKPAADHPWRRMPIGRARYRSPAQLPKL